MASPPADRAAALVLVTALAAEARPLIDHYRLAPRGDGRPFRCFVSTQNDLLLVISGVGKAAASAATRHVCEPDDTVACLNVGIAGHASRALGEACLAHRIDDVAGERSWYPPLVFAPPCPTAVVRTVERPCSTYPDDALYDMEAAGVVGAASPYIGRELLHAVKIVSDNRDSASAALNAARVAALVGDGLPIVTSVVESLTALARAERSRRAEPAGFAEILATTHFSTTRRRQLRRQLRRWAALRPGGCAADWVAAHGRADAGQILRALQERLDGIAPALGSGR